MKEEAVKKLNLELGHYGIRAHWHPDKDPSDNLMYLEYELRGDLFGWQTVNAKMILNRIQTGVWLAIECYWIRYNSRRLYAYNQQEINALLGIG